MSMREEISKGLKKRAVNNEITCSECFKMADELKVSLFEIGEVANELNIKVRNCQLGCF